MLLGGAQRGGAVLADQPGVEAVRRDVDGVDRLPAGARPRVVAGEGGVGLLQPRVELGGDPTDEVVEARRPAVHARTLDRRARVGP